MSLDKDELPDEIQGNVEEALDRTGVSWNSLDESQKKKIIGGGRKAHKLYKKYSNR